MRTEVSYAHRHLAEPELAEELIERLGKVNALFLLENLEASGVTTLRDLTYWACLASQPDYLVITHEALGMTGGLDLNANYPTNMGAWAELMYVLRVEESHRCWPDTSGVYVY